jgi:flagellum-specific peptidoglycan hydrolase FlgJ
MPAPPVGVGPPVGGGQDSGRPWGIGSIAQSIFAALIPPVGVGQDVGVGADDLTEAQTQALQGTARRYAGTPYRLGGNDLTKGIDCSGFVNEILKGFGANIPGRPSTVTYRTQLASPTSWDDIRPGDILLSAPNPRDPVSGEHMALYVGGGQMAESAGGVGVRIRPVQGTSLQPYRMRTPVPGLQDATRLAQAVPTGGDDTARVTPTSANNPMRLMGAQSQSGAIDTSSPEAFIRSALPMAQQVEQETGVPAALSVAVAANETGYGSANSGGPRWNSWHSIRGTGSAGRTPAGFRANNTPMESFRDFGRLISGDPAYGGPAGYAQALRQYQQNGDVRGLLRGIADAGYEVAGPERTRFVNQVNGHLDRIERTNPQSAQGGVQRAMQIPGNIMQMGQDLISTVLSATTPLSLRVGRERSGRTGRRRTAREPTGPGSQ